MKQVQYNPITRKDQRLPVRLFLVKQNHVHRVVPKHWHEGAELIYCHKGNHQVRVEKNCIR